MAVLSGMGIEARVFDYHISIAEGSIGAFPRRLMVADEDASRARWGLERAAAELEHGQPAEDEGERNDG